ncbi:hypothetical protein, partial [Candidatus Magnetobacterium casense]|uniref:hypothetical protein n=1 Tax=Candidatus Magnetobacterium casense TaxID=1455061 RepID=UPI001C454B32
CFRRWIPVFTGMTRNGILRPYVSFLRKQESIAHQFFYAPMFFFHLFMPIEICYNRFVVWVSAPESRVKLMFL